MLACELVPLLPCARRCLRQCSVPEHHSSLPLPCSRRTQGPIQASALALLASLAGSQMEALGDLLRAVAGLPDSAAALQQMEHRSFPPPAAFVRWLSAVTDALLTVGDGTRAGSRGAPCCCSGTLRPPALGGRAMRAVAAVRTASRGYACSSAAIGCRPLLVVRVMRAIHYNAEQCGAARCQSTWPAVAHAVRFSCACVLPRFPSFRAGQPSHPARGACALDRHLPVRWGLPLVTKVPTACVGRQLQSRACKLVHREICQSMQQLVGRWRRPGLQLAAHAGGASHVRRQALVGCTSAGHPVFNQPASGCRHSLTLHPCL